MKFLSIIFVLCIAFILCFYLVILYEPYEDTPILIPKNSTTLNSDKARKKVSLDFSKPFTKSEPYIYDDDYKHVNKNAYSTNLKYASDDASCTFWLNEYKQNNNGYNKVHKDKACNALIVTKAIRR